MNALSEHSGLAEDNTRADSVPSLKGVDEIVLYDIPSKLERRAWSPNMWKTRLVLNYKGIPYHTQWISYPDIEAAWKELGIPPSRLEGGKPLYTCPSIIDRNTSPTLKVVTDSLVIAEYLDETYSSYGPRIFPQGTTQQQLAFVNYLEARVETRATALVLGLCPTILEDPRGEAYFNETKLQRLGKALPDFYPAGSPERKEAWSLLQKDLDDVAEAYDKNVEGGGEYFVGNTITFADMYLVALLLWTRFVPSDRDGPDVKFVWDVVRKWHGGRWARLMEKFENHLQVL